MSAAERNASVCGPGSGRHSAGARAWAFLIDAAIIVGLLIAFIWDDIGSAQRGLIREEQPGKLEGDFTAVEPGSHRKVAAVRVGGAAHGGSTRGGRLFGGIEQDRQAQFFGEGAGHEERGCGAVGGLGGVACGGESVFLKCWGELGEFFDSCGGFDSVVF